MQPENESAVALMPQCENASQSISDSLCGWYKARRCKYIVLQERCRHGDNCGYAHSPEELRPPPEGDEHIAAPHWEGPLISIGIVEHAMFWDLSKPGTIDVVCNRSTCFGNPFAMQILCPDSELEVPDEDGWHLKLHEALCEAFKEYLAVLLDPNQEELMVCVRQIAARRSLTLAETWIIQNLTRQSLLESFAALDTFITQGHRLRLLCHCRPHVRCHAELIKGHLEERACQLISHNDDNSIEVSSARFAKRAKRLDCHGCEWPSLMDDGPSCGTKSCWQVGRAWDPGSMQMYCAPCWSKHSMNMTAFAEEYIATEGLQVAHADLQSVYGVESAETRLVKESGESRGGDSDATVPLCKFFASGSCKFGTSCWRRH